jgi:hypothetical protein
MLDDGQIRLREHDERDVRAIADTTSDELLGSIGWRWVERNVQVGYWVRREARRRGALSLPPGSEPTPGRAKATPGHAEDEAPTAVVALADHAGRRWLR